MDKLDGAEVCRLLLKLGLLNTDQLEEGREEAGSKNPDPQLLLRIFERKGYLTPFQTTKIQKGDTDGYVLGGYRLLYRIAAGTYGRVYRADDPNSGRIVAVKVLRHKQSEIPKVVDWFYREAKLGMTLRHPNIVEILAVNQDHVTKQHFMVMEFVEGGNLREFLNIRKQIPAGEALRLIEDATKGLVFAFSRGIAHRDMKLTNVLISAQGEAKLVDFGLAQQMNANSGRNPGEAENAGGEKVERTVDYAGLERATGAPPGDTRSDIYFLGCVLYEMLTGRSPIDWSKKARESKDARRFECVKPMAPEELKAPPSVFNLVGTMMSLALQQRYQTPSQLLDAVRAARRDVEGSKATVGDPASGVLVGGSAPHKSIFIIETSEKAQEKLREKFKNLGFRVFMASDPMRALERFRQNAFDALVINAGSVGEEGLVIFENILNEASTKRVRCAGILILSDQQAEWRERIKDRPNAAVMLPPVTLGGLCQKVEQLMAG